MKQTIASAILIALGLVLAPAEAAAAWDKTFPKSDRVVHEKVSYRNRFGIKIAADMYLPRNIDKSIGHPAIVVGTPYGGVKEQGAGIYAQTLAERGFVTIAFDESYNGESGGEPRRVSSPDIFVEDFSAGVDFLGSRVFVDREGIGAIGICGSGAFALTAAQVDHRIKAVATVSMYDMSRVKSKGWMDGMTTEQRSQYLDQLAEQRWKDVDAGAPQLSPSFPPEPADAIPEGLDPITNEFFEYYAMDRGFHPRSIAAFTVTSDMSFMNFPLLHSIETISPRPILFIMGENAHSRYFTEDAYTMAAEPKELYVVPKARHIDLYDRTDMIPFDQLISFFGEHLKRGGDSETLTRGTVRAIGGEGVRIMETSAIFPKGDQAPAQIFTNTTWVAMLHTDEEGGFDTQVYNVTFEPAARTHWHSHPGGQILLITEGAGYYQEKGKPARLLKPGDTVAIPADVVHWHGASPDSRFVHLGMSTQVHLGPAEWFGPVTDKEYGDATSE